MDLASASPIFATVTAARLPRNDWPEKGGEKGASLPIMRGMILSPLAIQLGIALILVLSIAVSTLSFALRSRKAGAAPTIRATFHKLKPGWYTSSRSRSPIRRLMASLLTNSGA
jgi:hypothetical protein